MTDSVISEPTEICNHFNRFFQSVFTEPGDYSYTPPLPSYLNANFIMYEGIFSLLLHLNTRFGCGPDHILNVFLGRDAESLVHFVIVIFHASFFSSNLCADLLMARVTPVFKNGDRLTLSNYHPIPITSMQCK